ncbi:metallophosphoesterase family protein [Paenibacillus chartarius]|uniref:Metallophosphoesterase family protein n=1 Tax=Paenibacillus chartarius TaxID=747481 RepID=A0ABV6DL48_9BACL
MQRFFQDGPEADLYVSLGDLTQDGLEREHRNVFGHIEELKGGRFFIHIPGNHDLLQGDAWETERWSGGTDPVRGGFGVLEREEAALVFLNTAQTRMPADWGGRLDEVQLEALRKQLLAAQGKPVLVFAHHPLPLTTTMSDIPLMRVEEADALLDVIGRQADGPRFWFNGHNHMHSIVRSGAWTCIQTASAVCLPGWRDIEVSGTDIRVETVVCADAELIASAQRTLDRFGSFHRVPRDIAAGLKQDRSIVVRKEQIQL